MKTAQEKMDKKTKEEAARMLQFAKAIVKYLKLGIKDNQTL